MTQASHRFIFVVIIESSFLDLRIPGRCLMEDFRYRGRRKRVHMLIITSDMHLTDHTVSPPLATKALERFQEIVEAAAKKGNVEIIFLGDTFDLLRSKWWILQQPWTPEIRFLKTDVRPWSARDQKPMDKVLERILLEIKNHYGWFFKALKKAGDVTLTWVVGNHDRLAWCTEIGKEFLAQLGIESHPYPELRRPTYGVLARHGHCYDDFNFYWIQFICF